MRSFRLLYRAVLLLTPRSFRNQHGIDALGMATARVRGRAGARRLARASSELVDLLLSVPALHREFRAPRGGDGYRMATPVGNAVPLEVRHALRAIRRSRLTTGVAVLVLGLSMGISTAVFSVADRVLFRPLPYPNPERLIELSFVGPRIGAISLTGGEFAAARAATHVMEQVEAYNLSGGALRVDGPEPERLRVAYVTPGFLQMLGARLVGEAFAPEHAAGSGAPVAILTYDYWKTRFGADERVIGSLLRLDGEPPVRVIGLLDDSFVFPTTSVTLLPAILRPLTDSQVKGDGRFARPIGRVKPGVGLEAVAGAIPVDPAIRQRDGTRIQARPLGDILVYSARRGLAMLFAGALVLLAIGVLDVSGLLVAEASGREREIVTMRALGASTPRIARQLLFEGLFVAAASGAVGLLVARVGFATMLQMVPPALQILDRPELDGRALAFAAAGVALTAIAFGLAPLLHLGGASSAALRAGGGQTMRRSIRRLSGALVAGQIAGAVALALVGGLLISSFVRVLRSPVGFDSEKLAFVSVSLPRAMLASRGEFYEEALRRLRSIVGVESAAVIDVPALRSTLRGTSFSPEGRSVPASERQVSETQLVVTREYFATAGLAVVEGRGFTDDDLPAASTVAIVNRTLARTWFPGQSAIGRRIVNRTDSRTVIGVVEDARHFALKEEPLAEVFLLNNPARPMFGATFVIRSATPTATMPSAMAVLRALAPTMPITQAETGAAAVARAAMADRFYAALLAIIAASAVALATIGLYGALSWSVGSRERELGVRAALGADARSLAWTVLRRVVFLVGIGAGVGGLVGWWGARFASSLLYHVQPADAGVWAGVAATISIATAIAVAAPTRRVLKTSPAAALRAE